MDADIEYLYHLLKSRPDNANISHHEMPTMEEHVKFCRHNMNGGNYEDWFIVEEHGEDRGSIYLTRNSEIGLFIEEHQQGKGYAKQALEILKARYPGRRFLANISPLNGPSIAFFIGRGFKLIQHTYELEGQ